MHIRKIQIEGFRSFSGTVVLDDLSPGLNMIVGKNGGGKSNILLAISLALSRSELSDLPNLVAHRIARPKAFIELTIDNSDRTFPAFGDEMTVKRIIHIDGTQLLIDNKVVRNSHEVLLSVESTNSLHFIKQGQITQLAMCTNAARLKRLLDATGYSAWKEDLEKSREKLQKLQENQLPCALEKLQEFSTEKETWVESAQHAAEYKLAEKTINTISVRINTMDLERNGRRNDDIEKKLKDSWDKRQELDKKWNNLKTEALENTKQCRGCCEIVRSIEQAKPSIRFQLENTEAKIQKYSVEVSLLKKQVAQLERSSDPAIGNSNIKDKIAELKSNIKKYARTISHDEAVVREHCGKLHKKLTEIMLLKEKLKLRGGEGEMTDEGIELYLNEKKQELKILEENLHKEVNRLNKEEATYNELKKNQKVARKKLNETMTSLKEIEASVQNGDFQQNINEKKVSLKVIWQDKAAVTQQLYSIREEVIKLELDLAKLAGKNTYKAVRHIRKVVENLKNSDNPKDRFFASNYYGLLCENFTHIEEECRTAVGVAAGMKLFYHIVEDSQTGKRIMKEFNKEKGQGEVNFLVLEKLNLHQQPAMPNVEGIQCQRLIDHIQYSPHVEKAFKFTFQNFFLCRDSAEIGYSFIKDQPKYLNFVTVDGTLIRGNGVLKGGYYDIEKSPITSAIDLKNVIEKENTLKSELADLSVKEEELSDELKELRDERSSSELDSEKYKREIRKLMEEIHVLEQNQRCSAHFIEMFRTKIDQMNGNIQSIEEDLQNHDFTIGIKVIEQKEEELIPFKESYENLRIELQNLKTINYKLQSEIRVLEEELVERDLEACELSNLDLDEVEKSLKQAEYEHKAATQAHNHLQIKLKKMEDKSDEEYENVKTLQAVVDKLTGLATKTRDEIQENMNELYRLNGEKNKTLKKLEDSKKALKQLEGLPTLDETEAAREQLDEKTKQELHHLLQACKEVQEPQIESLLAQTKVELYQDEIRRLREHVKETEDSIANLERLFQSSLKFGPDGILCLVKDVELKMQKCYEELLEAYSQETQNAWAGTPHLRIEWGKPEGQRIRGNSDASASASSSQEESENFAPSSRDINDQNLTWKGATLEILTENDQRHDIRSLSGGQKSILAFAFLIALQENLAPKVLLFDEIDQALDKDSRVFVASKLNAFNSTQPQVFCTTFSREFVEKAEKVFHVTSQNLTSKVEEISKEDALNLDFLTSVADPLSDNTFCSSGSDPASGGSRDDSFFD